MVIDILSNRKNMDLLVELFAQHYGYCGQVGNDHQFICRGLVIPMLCVIGLFGNAFALTVLLKRHLQQTPFRSYLATLCLTDSGLLVSSIFMFALPTYTDGMLLDGLTI